jgi:NAD(P)-dependent dehydrogenase (short-subunit alcohol dehydrogenase family)
MAGGSVEVAGVDALDADAVERHAARIVEEAGRLDVSFNLIGYGDTQGASLVDMERERFVGPISLAMEAHSNTATAAGRHMAASELSACAPVARPTHPASKNHGPSTPRTKALRRRSGGPG